MIFTSQHSCRKDCSAAWLTCICLFILVFTAIPSSAYARCQILFPVGTAPTIDGAIGNEWSDAQMTSTATNGCLAGLVPVEVRTKRDADNLYLAFTVSDSTQLQSSDLGERVIIQLSPSNLNGTTLGIGQSYKINVGHKWSQFSLDSDKTFQKSTTTSPLHCSAGTPAGGPTGNDVPSWTTNTWSTTGLAVSLGSTTSSGYVLEFKIPKADIGITGQIPNDIALAFVVVNDSTPPGSDYASWFPQDLPVDTVSTNGPIISPDDPTGSCNEWVQTTKWGLASLNPSGDVYISRLPEAWWSEDIDTAQCPNYTFSGNDGYNYYPKTPCRLEAKYRLRNLNSFDEKRDVLVLAGVHGLGQGNWEKIEFNQNTNILKAQGSTAGQTVFTSKYYRPPSTTNATGHPCVRVYILPTRDDNAFPKSKLISQSAFTDAELTSMEQAYRLDIGSHMAQQNISRAASDDCPATGVCLTAALSGSHLAEAAANFAWGTDLSLRFLGDQFIPTAAAEPLAMIGTNRKSISGQFIERYGRDHLILVIRANGYSATPPSGPMYRITQEIGGVVQLFPIAMLKEKKSLPVKLFVGNTKSTAQTVFLTTDVHYPPGWEGTLLTLSQEPRTLQPGGSFVTEGRVGRPCTCGDWSCLLNSKMVASNTTDGLAGGVLLVGVVGVGGFAFLRRRRQKPSSDWRAED